MTETKCLECGGRFAAIEGPTHRYLGSSPGCWACYGEVLSCEYSDLRYHRVHRLTVDAYSIQHPGQPSLQTIRSVALHAISLCAMIEDGLDQQQATRVIQRATNNRDRFEWLTPPASMGSLTVADVHLAGDADEHARLVWQWAESAWSAWSEHHATIRGWLRDSWALWHSLAEETLPPDDKGWTGSAAFNPSHPVAKTSFGNKRDRVQRSENSPEIRSPRMAVTARFWRVSRQRDRTVTRCYSVLTVCSWFSGVS